MNKARPKMTEFMEILDRRDADNGYSRMNFLTSDKSMACHGLDTVFKTLKESGITDEHYTIMVLNFLDYLDLDWDGKPIVRFDCKDPEDKKKMDTIIKDIRALI